MTATAPSTEPSDSITRTLDIVGDRWTLLVIRGVFRGLRRFSQLQEDLGIAKNLLSDRLQKLVEHDILQKVPYQERPLRNEYHLTERGRELSPALIAMMRWGDRWCSDGEPPVVLTHSTCGTEVSLAVTCPRCGVEVTATEIEAA